MQSCPTGSSSNLPIDCCLRLQGIVLACMLHRNASVSFAVCMYELTCNSSLCMLLETNMFIKEYQVLLFLDVIYAFRGLGRTMVLNLVPPRLIYRCSKTIHFG